MTPAEYREIAARAEQFNMSIADYVICRALLRKRRVPRDDDLQVR